MIICSIAKVFFIVGVGPGPKRFEFYPPVKVGVYYNYSTESIWPMTTCHCINFERSEILVKLVPILNSLVMVPEIKFPGLSCLVLY